MKKKRESKGFSADPTMDQWMVDELIRLFGAESEDDLGDCMRDFFSQMKRDIENETIN